MRLPKAHQVVLGVGVAMFVFVIGSGVMPAITGWHDHSHVQREVFVNVPTALKVAFYARGRDDAADRRVARVAAGPELGTRPRRQPAHEPQERREAGEELPQRRVDADAAARPHRRRSCTRSSTSGSSRCSSSRSSARPTTSSPTGSSSCTARRTRRTRPAPRSRASCSSSASCGRSRAATCSGRTASGSRPSPKTR